MLSYPTFQKDQMRTEDEHGTWLVLTSWGRRNFFEFQGCTWAFDGSLNLPPRDTLDFGSVIDFVQLVRDSFVPTAGRREQWPSWIKFLCLNCNACSMTAADDAKEAVVPVVVFSKPLSRRCASGKCSCRALGKCALCEADWVATKSLRRQQCSKWVEVLVEGKLGRNNALKLADTKQASALLFSVI